MERGDYEEVLRLVGMEDEGEAVLAIRAAANGRSVGEAERMAGEAGRRHGKSVEIQVLHAVLLLDLGRFDEAVRAARRVVYLEGGLAMGHFLLGVALKRSGERERAARAFRQARELCARMPAEEPVRFADGQRAGRLAEAAAVQLGLLAAGAVSS